MASLSTWEDNGRFIVNASLSSSSGAPSLYLTWLHLSVFYGKALSDIRSSNSGQCPISHHSTWGSLHWVLFILAHLTGESRWKWRDTISLTVNYFSCFSLHFMLFLSFAQLPQYHWRVLANWWSSSLDVRFGLSHYWTHTRPQLTMALLMVLSSLCLLTMRLLMVTPCTSIFIFTLMHTFFPFFLTFAYSSYCL